MFSKILKQTLEKLDIFQFDNIKYGFKTTGIYPLDQEKSLNNLSICSSIILQVYTIYLKNQDLVQTMDQQKNTNEKDSI